MLNIKVEIELTLIIFPQKIRLNLIWNMIYIHLTRSETLPKYFVIAYLFCIGTYEVLSGVEFNTHVVNLTHVI